MDRIQINTLPGYEDLKDYYYAQKDGQIWSDFSKKYLTQCKRYNSQILRDKWEKGELEKEPYFIMFVGMYKKNHQSPTTFPVHRIIATAFIPNPNNLPEVNHKDKNTTNNNINNLEWIEKEKNIQLGLSKGIWRCDKDTHKKIEYYESFANAARAGYNRPNIIAVCKGRRKSANGFFWEYDEKK